MSFDISYGDGALEVLDRTEKKLVRFTVDDWEPTDGYFAFRFPVDMTFSARCRRISYTTFLTFVRRNSDYALVAKLGYGERHVLPRDEYIIEIDAHCKVYVRVHSTVMLECDNRGRVSLEFEPNACLVFGVRSYHRRPAATIYTTRSIRDLARAVSVLSSSIKVKSCERSYPTLRGHPPLIEFADEFSADVVRGNSGVEITIPPKLEYLYVVAPLAYYLLADIEFGEPAIRADSHKHPLPKFPKFEDDVNAILQRAFFLDCLVRNAGLYKLDLHELKALDGLAVDLDELYSADIGRQLSFYLSVPVEKIGPYMPKWHLSSYVEPVIERARCLPFLLDRLSAIYLPRSRSISQREITALAVKELLRGNVFEMAKKKSLIQPLLKDSDSHYWLAEEKPIGIIKADEEAFYNRLKYASSKDAIRIALVVNDERMLHEMEMVQDVYAERKDVPLEVAVYGFLDREELSEVFGGGYDLVHYIGHCEEGLQCSDGFLKAKDIQVNNTPAFFLNACKSYKEGQDLIKNGSIGGVVTLYYIPNEQALRIGYNFTRLLSLGFPIDKAMSIAKTGTLSGSDYLILGDGGHSLVQNSRMNTVYLYEIRQLGSDRFQVIDKSYGYPARGYSMGGYFYSDIGGGYYLFQSEVRLERTRLELMKLLEKNTVSQPVIYENKLFFQGFQEHLKNKKEREGSLSKDQPRHRSKRSQRRGRSKGPLLR